MADLFDYLHWRGDLSFRQVPPGPVDALIFSALSYLSFGGRIKEQPEIPVPLREAAKEFFQDANPETHCRVKADLSLLLAAAESNRLQRAFAGIPGYSYSRGGHTVRRHHLFAGQ